MQTTIHIQGTHCPACKTLIEDVCSEIKGVISCSVNHQTGETIIEHNPDIDWQALKKEIEGLGTYAVELLV